MFALPLILISVIIFGLYYYFKKKLSYFKDLGIPYLPGWPLLGNMAGPVFQKQHISELVHDLYNVNGEAKYVGAFEFTREIIVLRDPELIKDIAIKHFDHFMNHGTVIDDSLDPLLGNLFNMTGERWREMRNLLSPAFTSSKMKEMFELMWKCSEAFVDYLVVQSDHDVSMMPTKELFMKYTNDAIAACAFGVEVNSLKNPKNEFYVYGLEAIDPSSYTVKLFLSKLLPASVFKFFGIRFIKDYITKFFVSIVKETVKIRDENSLSRPDMLQLMMDSRGKNNNKYLKLDMAEMTAQVLVFFFGGLDTTSTQMSTLAHELAVNPGVQKKLQDEIDKVMEETNGKPTYEAINKMLYLDAAFNESLRLHTQVSFVDRLCIEPYELPPALPEGRPCIVKSGTSIWIPATAIHRDSKYYDNPDTFDPDRYYEKKVTINDVTNLGFGIGPRGCIGNRFAILKTKILFFNLLSKFTLEPNAKTSIPMEYDKSSFVLRPKGGFWLALKPRT